MEHNKFFKWVWRLNGLFILLLLLFCLGWIIFFAIEAGRDYGQVYEPPVTTIQETDADEVLTLQLAGNKHSNEFILFTLRKEFKNITNIKGNPTRPVNLGIYQPETQNIDWMFPSNDQVVSDYESLTQKTENEDKSLVLTGWLVITFSDEDWDSKLKTVWILSPDGMSKKAVLENIEGNPEIRQLPDDRLIVFYKSDGEMTASVIDEVEHSISAPRTIIIPE